MHTIIMNESAKKIAFTRWKDLVENGKYLDGTSPNINPEKPPEWFDYNKFIKSQKLIRKYYASLLFGKFLGLLLGLYHAEALMPLMATGNSSTVSKLFRRYLSTILHVNLWYEYDPFDPQSKSFKSLRQVRNMHQHVAKMMNQKYGKTEGKDLLWLSQHSMAETQFAFIGFVVLYPKECGLHSLSDDDFDCLHYFWRVIGYCLGTDDRFNLFSGSREETIELCRLIYWNEWRPAIIAEVPSLPEGVEMAKGICLAISHVSGFTQWNVYMKYWYPILEIPKQMTLGSMAEYLWFLFIKIQNEIAKRLPSYHWFLSSMARINIFIASKFIEWTEKRLVEKYDKIYENKCLFDVNFNYKPL